MMQSLPAPSSVLSTPARIAVITIITIVEFHNCWKLGLKLFQASHIAHIYINNNSLKKVPKSKSKLQQLESQHEEEQLSLVDFEETSRTLMDRQPAFL